MRGMHRVLAIGALACAVGVVFAWKREAPQAETAPTMPAQTAVTVTNGATRVPEEAPDAEALPRLVDLGSGKCIPCQAMEPILEALKTDYASAFEVEFIDVWENAEEARAYGIRMIPTQIFYDAAGREMFRHEGFFGKEEILAKWRELGVPVAADPGE
jgi:thioredoxin 1